MPFKTPRFFAVFLLLIFFFLPVTAQAFSAKRFFFGKSFLREEKIAGIETAVLGFYGGAAAEKYPLILVFHGAGVSPESTLRVWESEAEKRGFMLAAPEWNLGKNVSSADFKGDWLTEFAKKYPVDSNRIYLAGVSAGNVKVLEMLNSAPQKWQGAVILAFASTQLWAEKVQMAGWPPILIGYGEQDPHKVSDVNLRNASILKTKGAAVKLLADPSAGHEHRPEWNKVIFDWLESIQAKKKLKSVNG